MSESQEAKPSAAEIEEVITELEKYRERLVNDVMKIAQKLKLPKKAVMAQIKNHPEIVKIDTALENLRPQESSLPSS
ncbi:MULTISPECIES: acetyltransferase [Moorena]|uniref:Acetyltransferase n=1 Tax=Moorena producens (strain JHB) TaxID=1454205 RepID=A0A1D9G7Y9_MOOP1|nr:MULTISPECIES: acetyltransferase [Moorena]AOY83654.1 acetyltransferase [Moorena producens JHB]NES44947.1 acetyltransferase [Moorena sp. SIO2C4]NET63419.1 acetyltransferase [Moorena sp. SIO1G6]